MKKVLIVEDDIQTQNLLQKLLSGTVHIFSAFTIEEAEEFFKNNPDIDIVTMDGCVPGENINTIPLIQLMRRSFKGPMVACSGNSDYQSILLDSGCNLKSEKKDLPKTILGLLDGSIDPNDPKNPYDPMYLIDISELDKAEVLVALYEYADLYGNGFTNPRSNKSLSIKEAKKLIKQKLDWFKRSLSSCPWQFDVVNGRAIKTDISGDIINTWLYARENGCETAQLAINKLRESPLLIVPQTKTLFQRLFKRS